MCCWLFLKGASQPRPQSSSAIIACDVTRQADRQGRLAKNGKFKMADDYKKNLRDFQAASHSGWDSLHRLSKNTYKAIGSFSFYLGLCLCSLPTTRQNIFNSVRDVCMNAGNYLVR